MRWAILLALLWGSVASAQVTHSPFILSVASGGGGGGIAGVEAACSSSGLYGSGGNCVCSEPMDVNVTDVGAGVSDEYDFPDSPNTHECWGPTRFTTPTVTLGVETGATLATSDVSASPGWGSTNYALQQTTPFVWAMAPIESVTSSTRTWCIKYFRQYEGAMSTDGSCRLKALQVNYGGEQLFQPQVKADGGSCTTTAKYHQLTTGPSDGGGANYNTSVYTDECDDKPCKFELCVDGNVQSGSSVQARFRVTSYEGAGEQSTVTSSVITGPGALNLQDFTGGDWWHSGGGSQTMLNGMFSVWAWDTDTDQWPPDTTEIEP